MLLRLAEKIKSITHEMIEHPGTDDVAILLSKIIPAINLAQLFVREDFNKITTFEQYGYTNIQINEEAALIEKYGEAVFKTFKGIILDARLSARSTNALKSILPKGFIEDDAFEAINHILNKISDLRNEIPPRKLWVSKEIFDVAEDVYNQVSEKNIAIFVGNTPQLIRYAIEKQHPGDEKFTKISFGISGHPDHLKYSGTPTSLLESILTEEGHENYKKYIQKMGITKESLEGHKISFIDLVGTGGGISYLMKALAEIAFDGDLEKVTEVCEIVNLSYMQNPVKPDVFEPPLSKVQVKNVTYKSICSGLDQVSDSGVDRIMPNSPSTSFSDRNFMENLLQISQHPFAHPSEFIAAVLGEIDSF